MYAFKGQYPQEKLEINHLPRMGEAYQETPLLQSIKQSDPTLKAAVYILCTE